MMLEGGDEGGPNPRSEKNERNRGELQPKYRPSTFTDIEETEQKRECSRASMMQSNTG
jgi:hypothetical protein